MSIQKLDIESFLRLAAYHHVIDVRSPAEYKLAHIPGAFNLPIFNDEERSVVGNTYKKESREKAIKVGLKYFGPRMVNIIEEMEQLVKLTAVPSNEKDGMQERALLVHCWRGGMRSAGVAWLLNLYGFEVYTLVGGYKSFRQWTHRQFAKAIQLKIIGGYTGSGKTEILHALAQRGQATIDLEGLGNHKGSSFGSIGMPPQPSQEMFENLLAVNLVMLTKTNSATAGEVQLSGHSFANPVATNSTIKSDGSQSTESRNHHNFNSQTNSSVTTTVSNPVIWLEDESQRIGNLNIPQALWEQMRKAPIYFFNISFEERLNHIVKGYGKGDKEQIVSAILRIKKRLGGLETKTAINFIVEDDLKECFRLLLTYYDKYYLKSLHTRETLEEVVTYIDSPIVNANANASTLLNTITL
jgi:tRNA 2-selenouridine synthase